MSNKYQALPGDIQELREGMNNSSDKEELRRFQAVYLRKVHNLSVKEISAITSFSADWVRHLHSNYRREGVKALLSKASGGRYHENMSLQDEEAFITPFLEKAKSGGILEVGQIHRAYEKAVGREVSSSVIYLLLHRHNWRKIAPRPRHPKADEVVQKAFKKTGQKSLEKRK